MLELPVMEASKKPRQRTPVDPLVTQFRSGSLKGLTILFVNMPLRESAKPNTPPQGPGLLAARTREYGANVSIVDLNAYRIKDEAATGKPNGRHLTCDEVEGLLVRHVGKHGEPHIIALSGMITTLRWQEFVSGACRRLWPDACIITGGGLATELRDGLFNWLPALDAVVHSEGDDVILELGKEVKRAFDHGRPRPKQKLYNGNRPNDLDGLPFAAWDLLHQDVDGCPLLEWYISVPVWGLAANNSSAAPFESRRSLTTVSSRGCPYSCKFCFRGAQGERNYGVRSPTNLASEMAWLVKTYGVDFVGFPDDNFAVRVDRCQALPEAFSGLGGVRWGTHTRLDEADMDRLVPMHESGCVYIGFGAESASVPVLERMGKGGFILRPRGAKQNQLTHVDGFVFPATMVRGIENCLAVGVHANCTWIMAYPGETLRDLQTTVAFVLWQEELLTRGLARDTPEYLGALAAVNRKMFVATAYPGTEMFKDRACRELLTRNFGVSFRPDDEPVPDEALRAYVLELDDATKVMHGLDGRPLNFGAMPEDQFLEAREYVDSGRIERILDMS